uniref:Zinc finger ZZ-type and EF-hand domain-containing protein 1 n=1 Tax=Magallana gigas TaxID=29159 RepID=K1PFX0_MAGGI
MDGNSSDGNDSDDGGNLNLTDLSGLFSHTSLRTLAANIKEEVPENVLQQYRFQILRWLEDKENKMEETLTISKFCDWLQNKGVSREEAARTFQQFDTDGSGIVEVSTMLTIIKSMNGQNVMGELGRSFRMLQACSLTPGFVDVYARDHDAVQQHAEKILKYLTRNRSPSLSLPFPYLNGFNNTTSMRNLVLKSVFQQIKDKGFGHSQGNLESGEEVRTINPCFSNIEVSSNYSDAHRLTNGDPSTFWQSDGSARSHWIRLHIKNNVVIKSLSVTVASPDSSYMPEVIWVSAGKNFRTLRKIKEVTIPRVIKEAGISVADASAMWYLQVLATTVTMTIPLAPQLRMKILEHTKKALGLIPPLSLCPVSNDRPKFLTKHVLQEVEKFVTDIALYDGEVLTEGLQVLLSFNLARGNVGALLRTIKLLQVFTASYLTSDGNTKVNMVFKSSETIQLSKLRIRVASGGKGARRGMVFVFKDDGSKFDMAKMTERFQSYDTWGKQEYDYSVQVRNTGLAGKDDDPVAFFSFDDDCDELDVPVSWHPTGEYVLVKFVDTRQEATKMGIVGIKFYGFNRKIILAGEETRAANLKHGIPGGKPEYLEFSDTPLENSSAEFFQHICKIIDSPHMKEQSFTQYELCRHLIIDGAAVFFPEKEARREQLFSMMRNVESLSKAPSVMLVFQSLCQFFSSVDPSGLLDLPKPNTQHYDISKVLTIMETMISVSSHEFTATLKTGKSQAQIEPLLQLVSALQTSLLSWCWAQIVPEEEGKKEDNNGLRENALQIITRYSVFVANKASDACKLLQSCDSVLSSVELLENSFLGSTVRQLITSDHWASVQTEDIVLRTWEVESSHNYENNQHQSQVFTCPGANKFVVDFDPRCETERRYDYLAFNDAKGVQMKFDQKVGTSKWPKQVNFSGPHLHFLFHSDSSNTEWGYKFKVTARGSPDIPLSWPFDLQLSLTKLMGRLCGATLKANPFAVTDPVLGGVSSEQDVLRSELWTSLFRGGYMIGKLERSLSGKFATADSSVLEFLWNVINKTEGIATKLIQKCKEQQKGVQIEHGNTDEAVLAVFAALVWHTQQLREDVQKLAVACKEKALFLLKFAGLTKVQLKNEFDALEKYPSFRLVIDFVQDPAWITERVNSMLQQRSQHAKAVSEVYSFCVQFLQIHNKPDIFQIPNVLFFQEMLCYQDGFCKHYADSLDGCGLQQESVVRASFYNLIRKITDTYHKYHRIQMEKSAVPAYEYIQACLLHLLDVEWQPYDLSFVQEVNLPALYLGITKETVKMRECTFGQEEENEELAEYNRCMSWFKECSEGFNQWYKNAKKDKSEKEEREVQMFVARFCDLLEVEITCDGCNVTLPGRRFRCLQCVDMDLCATCYASGVKPEGEHTDDHDIVHLVLVTLDIVFFFNFCRINS